VDPNAVFIEQGNPKT